MGLRDMVESMLAGNPYQTTGAHAAHIVEVLDAARTASQTGETVRLSAD